MAITHNDNGYNVRLQVPLSNLTVSSSMMGIAQPLLLPQRDQQGVSRVMVSSIPAATSVLISWDLPTVPYQIGNAGNNAPRGFQITDVTMVLAVSSGAVNASCNTSTMSFTAWTYPSSGFTDAATATTAPATYGGSSSQWLYNEGSSTNASFGGGLSAASTLQVIQAVPAAGLNSILNTDNQRVSFELYYIATASQNTLSIYDVTVHGKHILGG